jgi:nucleoside 2-deoxyribosyltransferase
LARGESEELKAMGTIIDETRRSERCPLCGEGADFTVHIEPRTMEDCYMGRCDRCGQVNITKSVVEEFRKNRRLYVLSACFRRYGGLPLLISLKTVDHFISNYPEPKSVAEKMNALLIYLANQNVPPGNPVVFSFSKDYPLAFAANQLGAQFLVQQLADRGFVESELNSNRVTILAGGYERIEELQAASYKSTRNAFVAMWFDKSQESIFNDAIRPAVEQAGYQAIRIDKTEHVNRIDDEIIAQLKQSRFVVADFTGQRAGVYYEAGFMHGLGRNVFCMVRKEHLKEVHFDMRQLNFIDYETAAEAKERLCFRIMAVEGKGPG